MRYEASINPYIRSYTSRDYADKIPTGHVQIDCSLGVNTDLLGNCIFSRLHAFQQKTESHGGNFSEIKYYPHGSSLEDALANWYRSNGVGEGWLTGGHFLLGNGSYDILCGLNLLCLTAGRRVLGHAPQFTAYIDHVNCSGSRYEACPLERRQGYRFDTQAYLDRMEAGHSLFIVENPNNPTGQTIPLNDLDRIARRALELGRILVVDEAYGEYIPFSLSAINLIPRYPQLIVTRSFSKGWGMAGVRLGYAVASTESDLLQQLRKLVLPFNSNGVGRVLAQTALETKLEHPEDPFGIAAVRTSKRALLQMLQHTSGPQGQRLLAAETFSDTPILMLYCQGGPGFSLQQHLLDHGILTVSGESYLGLDGASVRLMLPEAGSMPLLLRLLEEAVQNLPPA